MPHQLTLLGRARGAVLRRGAVKANLVHHLAHAGGETGSPPPRPRVRAAARLGPGLRPGPARRARRARSTRPRRADRGSGRARIRPCARSTRGRRSGEFWAHVGLAFNLLRVWEGDAAFRESLAHADAALALEPEWAWGFLLRGEIKRSLIDYAGGAADLRRRARWIRSWSWAHGFLARAMFQGGTDDGGPDADGRSGRGSGPQEGLPAVLARRSLSPPRALRRGRDGLRGGPGAWIRSTTRATAGAARAARRAGPPRRGRRVAAPRDRAVPAVREGAAASSCARCAARGARPRPWHELDRAAALNHRNDWLGVWRAEGQPDGASARQALAELDAHLARRPRDARALAWKGETLAQIGRLPEALAALDAALARAPRDAGARALARRGAAAPGPRRRGSRRPGPRDAARPRGRARLGLARTRSPLAGDAAGAEADLTRALSARAHRVRVDFGLARRGAPRLGRGPERARGSRRGVALDPGPGLTSRRCARRRARRSATPSARAPTWSRARAAQSRRRAGSDALGPALPWRRILEARRLSPLGTRGERPVAPAPGPRRHGEEPRGCTRSRTA